MSIYDGNFVLVLDIVVKVYYLYKIIMCGSVFGILNVIMLDNWCSWGIGSGYWYEEWWGGWSLDSWLVWFGLFGGMSWERWDK